MKLLISVIFLVCFVSTFGKNLDPTVKSNEFGGYVFFHFAGDTIEGEKIYLAASKGNDALNWIELNGKKPVFSSNKGTLGLRDPFIIRSHTGDNFYLIATDLSMGSGIDWNYATRHGSLYIEIWESKDLLNWSEQRHVLVSKPIAGNTWAPKAFYDETLGECVVFWASSLYSPEDTNHTGQSYNRMMYATTMDFVTFSEPQIWQDAGSRIDSTVLKEGETYYRFTKDEKFMDILQESSVSLTAPVNAWKPIVDRIGMKAGLASVEGPTSFKSNPGDVNGEKFYLFVDEYGRRNYVPLETDDIANPVWKLSKSFNLPAGSRHGSVIPVTKEELDRITSAYSSE